MYIDRILYPVTTLGPGNRITVWVAGCDRHCPGCANPELWEATEQQNISEEQVAGLISKIISDHNVEGITITGGEPFLQAPALADCLYRIKTQVPEILIFSGFLLEELQNNDDQAKLLKLTDVLIDGPYIRELNDGKLSLRGSSNQRIHYINAALADKYEKYLSKGRIIENFIYGNEVLSVGIHMENKRDNDDR